MQLPDVLQNAIDARAQGIPLASLSRAAAALSDAYRTGAPSPIASDLERIAYLATRLPATYAATRAVLADVRQRASDLRVESVLDIGAGPGTAGWAAIDVFLEVRTVALIERDRGWIELGRVLAAESPHAAIASSHWEAADATRLPSFAPHSLVVAGYLAGELPDRALRDFARAAWDAAQSVLAVIEPGTPLGFARILRIRDELLRLGAHMLSPCPHQLECPMHSAKNESARNDWCHFAARVERTSIHRRLKGGSLGYEDEKYSYAAFSRTPAALPPARIVGRPAVHGGLIELELCTAAQGLRDERITRKDKAAFRSARKAVWGGVWPPAVPESGDIS